MGIRTGSKQFWGEGGRARATSSGAVVGVDGCPILLKVALQQEVFTLMVRPHPLCVQVPAFKYFNAWASAVGVDKKDFTTYVVFDGMDNPLKSPRRGAAREAARALLDKWETVRTIDGTEYAAWTDAQWAQARRDRVNAQRALASYNGVLIALFRDWIVSAGLQDHVFVRSAFCESEAQLVAMYEAGLITEIWSDDSDCMFYADAMSGIVSGRVGAFRCKHARMHATTRTRPVLLVVLRDTQCRS